MTTDAPAPTVVLVDGSEVGWHALRSAAKRAATAGAAIVCVSVTPPRLERGHAAHFDPDSHELDAAFANDALRRAAAMAASLAVEVTVIHRIGRPVAVLAEEAKERSADRIVIGCRPRLIGFAVPDFAEQLRSLTAIHVESVQLPERPLPRPAGPAPE